MFGHKKKKSSFFEKLTGSVDIDADFDEYEEEQPHYDDTPRHRSAHPHQIDQRLEEESEQELLELEEEEGQLSVDVFQTPDEIVVKTMVAGVRPSDLDIDITRDMVTIRGTREEDLEVDEEDFYHRELYWGTFSRDIVLPEEIDVEGASAVEKNGLLVIRMPKLDKKRKTKLQVKSK